MAAFAKFPRAKVALNEEGNELMMRPDHIYVIMLMLRFGSLAAVVIYAAKIAAFAVKSM